MIFKVVKVFDCQEMPADLRRQFFEWAEQGNDTYVTWWIGDEVFEDLTEAHAKFKLAVDALLVKSGAKPATENKCGEEVLIKHWW